VSLAKERESKNGMNGKAEKVKEGISKKAGNCQLIRRWVLECLGGLFVVDEANRHAAVVGSRSL
jgi:hypothetical protein